MPNKPPSSGGSSTTYSASQIYALARSVGWNQAQAITATAIALAESRGNSLAKSPADDRGLWQINAAAHPSVSDSCAYNPICNAKAAFAISSGGKNWNPWVTYQKGIYKQFLPLAQKASGQHGSPPPSTSTQSSNGDTQWYQQIDTSITSYAQKMVVLMLCAALVGGGAYLLFSKQINSAVKSGARIGEDIATDGAAEAARSPSQPSTSMPKEAPHE